jgi:hypothetical protein
MGDRISEETILHCIDSGLDVFGNTVKNVIYWRLKTIYNLERKDILHKPEIFNESLRAFFGERAYFVEQAIVASILGTFPMAEVNASDSLTRAVVEARKKIRS